MNIDIPTQFNVGHVDQSLNRDLGRLGIAVERIARDPEQRKWPGTRIAMGDATLALDFVTSLTPPDSGTVTLMLPFTTIAQENHEAELIITRATSAIVAIVPPSGRTINGATSYSMLALPSWVRFKNHRGNWYLG